MLFPGAAAAAGLRVPIFPVTLAQGNYLDPGQGRMRGTTKVKTDQVNLPVYRKVRLMRESDGMVVREMWSDPLTGAYDFTGLNRNYTFTVIAYDHTGLYNGVIATGGVPELMP